MPNRTRPLAATVAALALMLGAAQVRAADLAPAEATPDVLSDPGLSPWMVRLRALHVTTNDSGFVSGVAGSDLSYSDTTIPELDISYFFTKNIAAELILGTTYAKIKGDGSLGGLGEIGKVWLLPPTLTLQYHFTDFGRFKPYVGAGVNYTLFYNQSAKSADDLDVKNKLGAALQVGFDYQIDDHWGFNVDVKKLFLRPKFDVTVGGTDMSGKAKLDPWLIGAGVSYRF